MKLLSSSPLNAIYPHASQTLLSTRIQIPQAILPTQITRLIGRMLILAERSGKHLTVHAASSGWLCVSWYVDLCWLCGGRGLCGCRGLLGGKGFCVDGGVGGWVL